MATTITRISLGNEIWHLQNEKYIGWYKLPDFNFSEIDICL